MLRVEDPHFGKGDPQQRSLICAKGHRIVNLDAPKAVARGKADGG